MTHGTLDLLPENIRKWIIIHNGDIAGENFLSSLIQEEIPERIYRHAAHSFFGYSFKNAVSTYYTTIDATLNVCNAVKDYSPDTSMYFAATSEMFGSPRNHH